MPDLEPPESLELELAGALVGLGSFLDSVFFSPAASDFPSVLVSVDATLSPAGLSPGVAVGGLARLSVTYQPEPLKMIPTGCITRRTVPPQVGQTEIGSSVIFWRTSKRFLHEVHSYSYSGIVSLFPPGNSRQRGKFSGSSQVIVSSELLYSCSMAAKLT